MRHAYAVFFFCVIFCVSAFGQERGIVLCDRDSTGPVPAWTAPGSSSVVEQLSCGQSVSIISLERGYFRIQIGDRFAYVYAKYVRLLQTGQRRTAQPEEPPRSLEQKPVRGLPRQVPEPEPTRFDVAGIFDWVRMFDAWYDDADFFGWNFAFNGNLTKHFGLEANVFGNYWNSPVSLVGLNYHGLAGGPRFSFPGGRVTPFVHVLVGFAHASAKILGIGVSGGTYLTLMPGFGMDVNLNRRFAIRAFQADYPVLHGEGDWSYKNLRIGGGFVVRF